MSELLLIVLWLDGLIEEDGGMSKWVGEWVG